MARQGSQFVRHAQRVVASGVAASLLVACAVPPQVPKAPGGASNTSESQSSMMMTTADVTKLPCDDAARKEAAWGNAFAGSIMGALAGAIAGALLDRMLGNKKGNTGAKAGAVAGAAIGGKIGYDRGVASAKRQCEVWRTAQSLAAEQAFATLQIGNQAVGEVVVTPDDGHFIAGTAALTPRGEAFFRAAAEQYTQKAQLNSYAQSVRTVAANANKTERDPERKRQLDELNNYAPEGEDAQKVVSVWKDFRILLTGHTSDKIDPAVAQSLSEGRAITVAKIFSRAGIPEAMLLYQGAGSAYPIADNATADGQAKNNRVEIVVLYNEKAVDDYQTSQSPNWELFDILPPIDTRQDSTPATSTTQTASVDPKKASAQTTTAANNQSKTTAVKPAAAKPPAKPASAATTTASNTTQPPQNPAATGSAKPQTATNASTGQSAKTTNSGKPATTAPPAATAKAPSTTSTAVPVALIDPPDVIDFGGSPLIETQSSLVDRLGKLRPPSISFAAVFGIGTAVASRTLPLTCHLDNPQRYKAGEVKKLSTGEARVQKKPDVPVADTWLGIKNRSYAGMAGPHYIEVRGFTPMSNGDLAAPVSLQIYLDFAAKNDADKGNAKADHAMMPTALAIRGEGGLLVRQFFARERGVECMDFLVPNNLGSRFTAEGQLIYQHGGQRRSVTTKLQS